MIQQKNNKACVILLLAAGANVDNSAMYPEERPLQLIKQSMAALEPDTDPDFANNPRISEELRQEQTRELKQIKSW